MLSGQLLATCCFPFLSCIALRVESLLLQPWGSTPDSPMCPPLLWLVIVPSPSPQQTSSRVVTHARSRMSAAQTPVPCSPLLPLTCPKGFIKTCLGKIPCQKGPMLILLKFSYGNFTTNFWDMNVGVLDPVLSVMKLRVQNRDTVICSR